MLRLHRRAAPLYLALSLVVPISRVARADTILTFTPPCTNPSGVLFRGQSYTESGFTITGIDQGSVPGSILSSICNSGTADYGGPALFVNLFDFNAVATLVANSGDPFNLLSIDLAPFFTSGPPSAQLTFTGHLLGGGVVTQTFAFGVLESLPPIFSTYVFNSTFTNLVSFDFAPQGDLARTSPSYSFTNVRLDATTVTPEPRTFMLLAPGLVGLTLAARVQSRKKRWFGLCRD